MTDPGGPPRPPCGTEQGYRWHYKRRDPKCGPCWAAHSRRVKRNLVLRAVHVVPAGPTRERLQDLRSQGMTIREIERQSGINHDTLYQIAAGKQPRVTVTTAHAVDGVRVVESDTALICSAGTLRRIRAMLAAGWTHRDQSARSGVVTSVLLNRQAVTVATARAIRELCEDIGMAPGPSRATAGRARRLGYAPLLAWDDIDDPDAQPDLGARPRAGVSVESIEWLAESGLSAPLIAARLGVTVSALEHACRRENRYDVWRSLACRTRPDQKEQEAS